MNHTTVIVVHRSAPWWAILLIGLAVSTVTVLLSLWWALRRYRRRTVHTAGVPSAREDTPVSLAQIRYRCKGPAPPTAAVQAQARGPGIARLAIHPCNRKLAAQWAIMRSHRRAGPAYHQWHYHLHLHAAPAEDLDNDVESTGRAWWHSRPVDRWSRYKSNAATPPAPSETARRETWREKVQRGPVGR